MSLHDDTRIELSETIGRRINSALAIREMHQKDLAKQIGVVDNTVSYYCSGARPPSATYLFLIAESLNVSADYLLGLSNDPERTKATADDLGLSPLALKNLKHIASASSTTNREYADVVSKLIESKRFSDLVYALFMASHVGIAEYIYNEIMHSVSSRHSGAFLDISHVHDKVLAAAESGQYNSVISSYLRQMVRFDKGDSAMLENDDHAYDVSFDRTMIPFTVRDRAEECFRAVLRSISQEMERDFKKQQKEMISDGIDP